MPVLLADPGGRPRRTGLIDRRGAAPPALASLPVLTGIHPHALAAAATAEAAALQGRFWDMHELLYHRQKARQDADLRGYAAQLGLDVAAFDRNQVSGAVAGRIRRDVDSGLASGQVLGTPTLFINGVVHRGGYDPPTLLAALAVPWATALAGRRVWWGGGSGGAIVWRGILVVLCYSTVRGPVAARLKIT